MGVSVFGRSKRKSPRVIATGGYTGEVWYQEGPRRDGGKQVRAVPGLSLSYKDKEIKPPEKC